MGVRPRLEPRSTRLIVPLGNAGAVALHGLAMATGRSIRSIVLEALEQEGLVQRALAMDAIRPNGMRTGAGRPRQKTDGYEISVELPLEMIEELRHTAQRRGVSIIFLVRAALDKVGIPVEPHELLTDRRRRGMRTPRRHYAEGVRGRQSDDW